MKERPDVFTLSPYSPLAQGLVFAGLGRFTGSAHYHDSSLYGNHGTLTSGATTSLSAVLARPGIVFPDSGNPVVTLPLYFAGTLTMSAWICPSSFPATIGSVFGNIYGTASRGYFGIASDGDLYWRPNGSIASSVESVGVGVLAHIVCTQVGDIATLYLNGVIVAGPTDVGTPTTGTTNAVLGTGSYDGSDFAGLVCDPCVWERVLTYSEISALADPSNVMLSLNGNDLLRYRRKWWPVRGGASGGPFPHYTRRLYTGGMVSC